jgi:urea transport system ATP-binding protein
MLRIEQLEVAYDGSRILRGVTLNVAPGEVVCLMGRNGVGKTTALKAVMGLVRTDGGGLSLGDTAFASFRTEARARLGLGYVPQGRDIFPGLTVEENLQIGALALGRRGRREWERAFALFPVLKEMLRRKGGVLSGGQQQQLAIARALMTEPKFLLLDEPTEGIQPNVIDQIGATIRAIRGPRSEPDDVERIGHAIQEIRAEGRIGVLLVEQCLDFCLEVGDRFYVMDRGAIVVEGAMDRLDPAIVKEHLTV